MNLLIVGNAGSFFSEISAALGSRHAVTAHPCPASAEGFDTLVHQLECALTSPNSCLVYAGGETRLSERMLRLNYTWPARLASLCHRIGRRFVYLSSLSVYECIPGPMLTESAERLARTAYGVTKLLLDVHVDALRGEGLSSCALAPASITGPRRQASIERVIAMYRRLPFAAWLQLHGWISFATREDVARALLLAIDGQIDGSAIVARNIQISAVADLQGAARPLMDGTSFAKIALRFARIIDARAARQLASATSQKQFLSHHPALQFADESTKRVVRQLAAQQKTAA